MADGAWFACPTCAAVYWQRYGVPSSHRCGWVTRDQAAVEAAFEEAEFMDELEQIAGEKS